MVGLTTALIGIILIVALPLTNNGGRLAGYYMTQASPTPFVAILSLISTNVAGYTKKTTIAALYLIGYCVGNIIGEFFVGSQSLFCMRLQFRPDRKHNSNTHKQQVHKHSAPLTPHATPPPRSRSSSAGARAWSTLPSSIGTIAGRTGRRSWPSLRLDMSNSRIRNG